MGLLILLYHLLTGEADWWCRRPAPSRPGEPLIQWGVTWVFGEGPGVYLGTPKDQVRLRLDGEVDRC